MKPRQGMTLQSASPPPTVCDMVHPENAMAELTQVRDKINRLLRAKDPVTMNNLAVELVDGNVHNLLRAVRRWAAQLAIEEGMTAAEYARRIGVSRSAVTQLIRHEKARRAEPDEETT